MSRPLAVLAVAVLALASAGASGPLRAPVSRTLPNGLRVVVFQRPGLPIVQAQLQVPAGIAAQPQGHAGLAYLTAQMLRQGTSSRSAEDFATELDTLGATLALNVTRDAAQVVVGGRVQELENMLEMVSDAVVNPSFSDEAFQSVRHQIATQLGQRAQNPVAIADDRAAALAFGKHPYGRSLGGDIEALLGTTLDQAREFHRDHWRPDRAVLAIAGDIEPERAFASATEWFGRWTGTCVADAPHGNPMPRKGVMLLDLSGSPATEVRAAIVAPGRGDPDFAGWTVAREALEGDLLPAGVHAALVPGRDASLLMVSASARPESTAAVAGRIRATLRAFASSPPAGEALEAARRRAAQAWPLTLETLGQLLASWLAGDAAGLPTGHLAESPRAFRTGSVAGVARSLAGGYTLLLVGPAERMKDRLASLGTVETLVPESEPKLGDATAEATPEQRRRGKQLVASAVAAHGGAAKLAAVRTSEMDSGLRMTVTGRDLEGECRFLRSDPARLVYTTRFLQLEHRQVLDGDRGWALTTVGDSATMVDSDSTSLLTMRAVLESDVVHLLRSASSPAADPISRGKGVLDGKPCDLVEFVAAYGGRTRLSLDPATHRILAVDGSPTPQGVWRDRRRWSEYILVEGVWWPRNETHEIDGQDAASMIVRRLTVNSPVDSMLFRRPLVVRGQVRGVQ